MNVLTVSASDKDSGLNGVVMYEILEGNEAKHFAIDSVLGAITIDIPLDYEATRAVRLKVRATDMGAPALYTDAWVDFSVTDANDNLPEFVRSSLEGRVT
jgi:hypothetical protein